MTDQHPIKTSKISTEDAQLLSKLRAHRQTHRKKLAPEASSQFEHFAVASPTRGQLLADLGARVIKIERPGEGDFARGYDATVNGMASHFVWLNRSKESLTLDLKRVEAAGVLRALIARADVFLHNLAPGAVARLGFDSTLLREAQPQATVNAEGDARWPLITKRIAEWQPDALVVGVPFHPDGAAHENTLQARKFARQLQGRFNLPVFEVDERYTSVEAEAEGAHDVDAAAAALILEQFFREHP